MAKTGKLPKKLFGLKVPKRLRTSGRSLADLLESPTAREVLAAMLTAAAAALTKDRGDRKETDAGVTAKAKEDERSSKPAQLAPADLAAIGLPALPDTDGDEPRRSDFEVAAEDRGKGKRKHRDKPSAH